MPAKPSRPKPAARQSGRSGGSRAHRSDSSRQDAVRQSGQPSAARHTAQSRSSRSRRARSDPARRVALDVLRAVSERDAYANLLLPSLLTERGITGRDAAFATELTYGTLRGRGTYDAILAVCSDRDRLDAAVRDVLRLGAHQLLATRTGRYAAVSTSVDLAKEVCGPRPSGFVNAVLRRVASRDLESWLAIVAPDRTADEVGHLAIRHSYPRWIVESFRNALPAPADTAPQPPIAPQPVPTALEPVPTAPEPAPAGSGSAPAALEPAPAGFRSAPAETEQALAAGNARPEVVLAVLPSLSGPMAPSIPLERANGAASTLDPGPSSDFGMAGAERTRWSPFGLRLAGGGDPAPLIATGQAAAQDEASQLVAIALSRAPLTAPDHPLTASDEPPTALDQPPTVPDKPPTSPDSLWLDLCAGPGGKARLLHHLAVERGARLIAGELRPHRAGQVRDALSGAGSPRSSASATKTRSADATTDPRTTDPRSADAMAARSARATAGVVVADGRRPPWLPGTFDRVLADVPCSGLGSLRRRPEARWRKNPSDISELADLQRQLLTSAIESVRPGGVVAYVTCSPHLAETRDVVTSVVNARSDVTILDAPAVLAEAALNGAILAEIPDLPTPRDKRFVQFWPHRHGTDAIFLALLRRE
jgi:16S rRNA (cytosine967-C5)-methyltransferase